MGAKQLNIDFFTDGLGEVEFNCIDIPIAAACGTYDRKNYFFYLMQICVSRNWERKDGKKDLLAQYMGNLGLKFERIPVSTDSLVNCIVSCINADWPVLLPVTYYEMFFSSRYKRNSASHFLLAEGYIKENNILLLREELSFISSEKLKAQKGLYPLRLKNDMVLSMWKASQELLVDRLKRAIFTVKPVSESAKISGTKDFLQWMLKEYRIQEDLFSKKLMQLSHMQDINLEETVFELRTNFHKYMYAFFYLFRNCIGNKVEKQLLKELALFENAFLMFREISISKFHISRIKGCPMELDEVKSQSERYNRSLYILLKQIYKDIGCYKEEIKTDSENIAYNALISASSSEDETIKGPERVLENNQTIWKSKKTNAPHWLMFRFPEPAFIQEITIIHHNEAHKMTVDFTIQGSMDGVDWVMLEQIENNHQPVTKHTFENARYIYYRIYITLPALRNSAAIIKYVSMK